MLASQLLSDEQKKSIEQAVADAEKRTAAEFVVVLSTRSGRYDRAEDTVGLITALAAVAAAWLLWQQVGPDTRDWHTGMTIALGLLPLLLIFAAWAILGAAVASWFPLLARPLIPRSEMTDEVRRAGIASFHTLRLGRTAGANGLLIYVSLFERTVWVCADDAIAERLPDDAWIPVRDTITAGFRRGTDDAVAASLRDAVARAADLLAPHFPVRAADADELPNHLHVLD